ncbi:hypothetical protein [Enterococcus sp. 5H]|uniref:hypothetical protein n=1 Tax=Enterococcus sp. 5H TaxID=1229490 RepID=UPI0023026643|nr:hypothetical protein [Enterococcus sp. 5H]MDA9470255.1 hypothetical protein [Enterococcus sp. 5H]
MIIVKGNNPRKIEKIWELVKREHTGKKIAVISYSGEVPHNFIRAKQISAYETMTKQNMLTNLTDFLSKIKGRYEAIILYIDCEAHLVEPLRELAASHQEKFVLTVYEDKVDCVIER